METESLSVEQMELVRIGVLLLAISAVLTAGVVLEGECSTAINPPDFDLQKFADQNQTWYEIMRIDNDFEEDTDCNRLNLTLGPFVGNTANMDMDFIAHYKNFTEGVTVIETQVYRTMDELVIYLPDPVSNLREKYVIMKTDFDNYAIMYSCFQIDDDFKEEKAWVVSRKKYLHDPFQDIVDDFLVTTPDEFPIYLVDVNTYCKENC